MEKEKERERDLIDEGDGLRMCAFGCVCGSIQRMEKKTRKCDDDERLLLLASGFGCFVGGLAQSIILCAVGKPNTTKCNGRVRGMESTLRFRSKETNAVPRQFNH